MEISEAKELSKVRSKLIIEYINDILSDGNKLKAKINLGIHEVDGQDMCTADIYVPYKDFERHFNLGIYALGGFVSSAGFVLLIVGGVMAYMAHRREITAYTTQQTMPIKKETINDITPTVADAAGTIAKSVSQGFEEGKKETDDTLNKVD